MKTTVFCCDLVRTSNYCPDCGVKLDTNPLGDLLRFCQEKWRPNVWPT